MARVLLEISEGLPNKQFGETSIKYWRDELPKSVKDGVPVTHCEQCDRYHQPRPYCITQTESSLLW
jgi:hypothetical protein